MPGDDGDWDFPQAVAVTPEMFWLHLLASI